ncbi:MAG TPA: Lrp/AsnC family transcriptional regulator [Ktedonobacteraceae bacterium]|nr:Lrp/AsnC family transcriptional regulator [Ktedonobacteraceae bacterium]
MTLENEKLLDETGWRILQELQENARLSFSELGQRVGLSSPAVAERVRRLEDAGIITGYRAEINLAKIGYPMPAIIRMSTQGDMCSRFASFAKDIPEIQACYRVTGTDSYIMRVVVSSVEHLESLIDLLEKYGTITTSMVLSTPVSRRNVGELLEREMAS